MPNQYCQNNHGLVAEVMPFALPNTVGTFSRLVNYIQNRLFLLEVQCKGGHNINSNLSNAHTSKQGQVL